MRPPRPVEGDGGDLGDLSRRSHPVRWWKTAAAETQRVDMLAKACSVVLWGWEAHHPTPPAALEAIAQLAEPPAAVTQVGPLLLCAPLSCSLLLVCWRCASYLISTF